MLLKAHQMITRTIFIALICATVTQVWATNWNLLGKNETVEVFIDLDSIKDEGITKKVNSYMNLLQSPNPNYKSLENEYSIFCQENTYIEFNPIIYSDFNRVGPVARGTRSQEKKSIDNKGSIPGAIAQSICRNEITSTSNNKPIAQNTSNPYANNTPTIAQLKKFLERDINWTYVADNSEHFPVYVSKDELFINAQGDLFINALVQYKNHVNGGISRVFSLKIKSCFNQPFPSWTRYRNRYYSEINGRGVALFDGPINEEVIQIDPNNTHFIWSKVALSACSLAKKNPPEQLTRHEEVEQLLTLLATPSGAEFYKQFQLDDEKKFKKIRVSNEKTRMAEFQKRYSSKEGVIDMRNRSSMAGSCFAILQSSHNFDAANKANKWASIDGLRFTEGMSKGFEAYSEAPKNILQTAINYCLGIFR